MLDTTEHSMNTFVRIFPALVLAAPLASAQPILAQSRFDADRDGWTTLTDLGNTFIPVWSATGGNPDGCISQTDPDGGFFFFRAPAKFLGDQSAAFGGTLSFDLRESGNGTLNDPTDILLNGGTLQLYYNTAANPETFRFSRYNIVLSDKALWHVGSLAGPLATAAEFQQVLANLTDILIRGEFVSGNETTRLDNVIVRAPRTELPSSTFDTDTEEWDVIADAYSPVWSNTGNPGGALRVTDIADGRIWRFLAPAKFMGDLSSAYGGNLHYDILVSRSDLTIDVDCAIVSETARLEYNAAFNPAPNTWHSRSVPLIPTSEWKLNGVIPTAEQFRAVLSAVTQLEINGEYYNGEDIGQLDNVFFSTTCTGDLNNDGFVDDSDFVTFVGAYNLLDCADPAMPAGCPADFNSDNLVDDADFVIFIGAYNALVCP